MSCKPTYKGKRYNSLEELKSSVLASQKQEAQQLYSQYLDTIFPDSKVKDIVYHGTHAKFDKFDYNYLPKADAGFYFTKDKKYAENFGNPMPALLNTTNPNYTEELLNVETVERLFTTEYKESTDSIIGKDAVLDLPPSDADVIVMMRDNQIHILGSKQDIEGFKRFVDNTNSIQYQLPRGRGLEEFVASEKTIRDLAAFKNGKLQVGKFSITEEEFNSMTKDEQDNLLKCL